MQCLIQPDYWKCQLSSVLNSMTLMAPAEHKFPYMEMEILDVILHCEKYHPYIYARDVLIGAGKTSVVLTEYLCLFLVYLSTGQL